jgi:hypothetical protein
MIEWRKNWVEAQGEARSTGRPIFLFLFSPS